MPSWLRRPSPQPSHPTQGGSRKRRGRGLGSRWCHRRSLQQREVTWFGVSFCVWAFGAHTQVCARVCAVQCVERIVRAARRPRSVWRGADLLNMNELGVRVRSHTTSYTREQPSARTTEGIPLVKGYLWSRDTFGGIPLARDTFSRNTQARRRSLIADQLWYTLPASRP